MAEWKKVVVSGSSAELSALTLDTALVGGSGGTGLLQSALTAGSAGQILALNSNKTGFELADASSGDITGIDAGTGIAVTDGDTATPTVSVTSAISTGAAAGATANQDNTATILAGNLTGTVDGTAVATIKSGAAAGATANQDATSTILADSALTGTTTAVNLNISGDQVVAGNLTVQGTASFQDTENLKVADKFIALASGSAGATDGGIVVEQSNVGGGKGAVFAFDGLSTGRWGVDLDFNPSASAYTPAAFMSNVVIGGGASPAASAPASAYVKAGNIYAATDESLWIYSA